MLAHPARYRLSAAGMTQLLDRFVAAGGDAIEVVSGAHSEDEMRFCCHGYPSARLKLASRASDFHGEQESPD